MLTTSIDLIIRIKNGYTGGKNAVDGQYSNVNKSLLTILKSKGYIQDFEVVEAGPKKSFVISLLYKDKKPVMQGVRLISKPGRKFYAKAKMMKSVLGGLGIAIVSTSHGLMTQEEATKKGQGGQILFEIW